jgi:hypothetical protein
MQRLEVSGAVRHIYIYIYVVRRLKDTHKSLALIPQQNHFELILYTLSNIKKV